MKIAWLFLIIPTFTGCSVYESPGRKFLETQAYQYAGVSAQADLVTCNREASTTAWVLLDQNPRADVYAFEGETYELRVRPALDNSFSCYYKFPSAQDMFEKSSAAVDLTLTQLNSGLATPKTR